MAFIPQSGSVIAFQQPGSVEAVNINNTPSVSGTVGASIIGLAPVNVTNVVTVNSVYGNISGSVVAFQGTNPWIITGSVQGSFSPSGNQSVSGTVGASIIGVPTVQTGNNSVISLTQGSIAAVIIGGSILTSSTANQSVSGTVHIDNFSSVIGLQLAGSIMAVSATVNTGNSSVQVLNFPANQSVSGTVGASILGYPNVNIGGSIAGTYANSAVASTVTGVAIMFKQNISTSILTEISPTFPLPITGAVAASISGTVTINPPSVYGNIAGSVVAFQGAGWSGSVAATITNTNVNVAGSVVGFQGTNPWIVGSIVGTYAEDVASSNNDKGLFTLGIRNDTVSSLVNADGDYTGWATDSAGRHLIKPFAAEEATFRYVSSVVSGSVTLIQASAIGKKSYITDMVVANSGSVFTLITIQDGSTSILGYIPAPATGGAIPVGWSVPLKTAVSQDLTFKMSPSTSLLYMTVNGYQAP